jgi:hypothetical protein
METLDPPFQCDAGPAEPNETTGVLADGQDVTAGQENKWDWKTARRLSKSFFCNRTYDWGDPVGDYGMYVREWAGEDSERLAELCQHLLWIASNPVMLNAAVEAIRRRRGKAAFRDVPFWVDERFGGARWAELREIRDEIRQGRFRRGEYKQVRIPKGDGTSTRTIEVPPIETQVVSKSLVTILSPILDLGFSRYSMGARPGCSVHLALALAERLYGAGFTHWVACDLRDAYGTVPRRRLGDILRKRLHGSPVVPLVNEVLGTGRKVGFPQGISVSPLMLNLYLDHFLDHWWAKKFPGTVLIRYLDDLLVLCRTPSEAEACYEALRGRVQTIGMAVKETASEAIYDLRKGERASWLGFTMQDDAGRLKFEISPKSWDRLRLRVRELRYRAAEQGLSRVRDRDVRAVGVGRIREKSIAMKKFLVSSVANRIRRIIAEEGGDPAAFSDAKAIQAWHQGQATWKATRERIESWDFPELQ